MSISDYGIWTQIGVTIGLLSPVILLGLPTSMIRFLAAERDKAIIRENFYSIFTLIFFTSAGLSIIFFVCRKSIAVLLFNGNVSVEGILPIIIFMAPLNGLLFNFFRTFQQIKRHSAFIFINTYLNIAIVAYFILKGHGIYGAAAGMALTQCLLFPVMFSLVASEIGISMPRFLNIKKLLAFGLPVVPEGLASWILNSSDRYFIGFFLGAASVGAYSPGYILGNMVNMFVVPVSFLLPALLARFYDSGDIRRVEIMLSYSVKYFLALAIPSAVGLSLLSKPILEVLSTPQIASQGYLITPFTALSSIFLGLLAILSNAIVLKKRTQVSSSIWVASAMLNASMNAVIIPRWGIMGAALTTLLSFSFVFALTAYCSFRCLSFPIDLVFVLKCIASSAFMSLAIALWTPVGFLQVILLVSICSVLYFIMLIGLGGFKREELIFFRESFDNIYWR